MKISKLLPRKISPRQHKQQPRVRRAQAAYFFVERTEVCKVSLAPRSRGKSRFVGVYSRRFKPAQLDQRIRELDERFSLPGRKAQINIVFGHVRNRKSAAAKRKTKKEAA